MKIKCVIANYGEYQWEHCKRIIDHYIHTSKYDIDIVLVSTSNHDITSYNGKVTEVIEAAELGDKFPYACQKYLANPRETYDYYMYFENDILIEDIAFDKFFKYYAIMPDRHVPGFLVVEKYDGYLNLVELFNNNPIQRILDIGPEKYIELSNQHQCGYILSNKDFNIISKDPRFTNVDIVYADRQTGACTNVFAVLGIKKYIPMNDLDDSIVTHITNAYYNRGKYTYTKFKEDIQTRIK